MEDGDLARHMRLAGAECAAGATRVVQGDCCFVLHSEDGLAKRLRKASRGGPGRYALHTMSYTATGAGAGEGPIAGPSQDGGRKIVILVPNRREAGAGAGAAAGAAERAELTSKSKKWLARMRPGRRLRMLNLGLGVAIFATMSATSLVALSPPLSYVFAAGALAPAGIMLARAAGGHA